MTKKVKFIFFTLFASVFSVLVHNLIFGLIRKEEWFFFGLALLFFLAFVILLAYCVLEFVITKEPADLWKAGFLGLFGLIGLLPEFSSAFFGFFGLFGLIGIREYI